jgi:hypothetical protein
METITSIITWYGEYWATNVPDFADWAFIYAWLAGASAVTAIVTLIFVIFNREAGAKSAALIGQQVLVLGVPLIWGQANALYGGGEATAMLESIIATAPQLASVLM